jgi:hypothetical protein
VIQPTQPAVTQNPVLALLLICMRPRLDGDASKRILAIARSAPDWAAIIAAAAEHSLTPLVCKNLEAYAGEALPSLWSQRFNQEFLANSCRNLALTAELFSVLAALENDGVCATPYKGPILASQAYGDIALRQFSDLDILVPQRHIVAAHRALIALGFRSVISGLQPPEIFRQIPGQYAYRKDPETLVELHTEATLRYFPKTLDLEGLCQRRMPVTVAGRQVLTFSLEDTLLLLSVHGSKHLWERLGWIADIAGLTEAGAPDWSLALERARAWGVQRMVLLGAGLAAQLQSACLPDEIGQCLKGDRVARRLINGICQGFFAAERAQLGVFSRFASRVQMRGTLAVGIPYALRLATMPTESDRGRHGHHLELLYAVRRPLRLARLYGWRDRVGPPS